MIRIRHMNINDLALGMRLKDQAGWNQTEADWRRMLSLEPEGCFLAEWNGEAVGTTATCIFGPVAWIAMVLVDESMRGRGIGKALMEYALTFLDESRVRSVRLDATDLGRPVYEKLGFKAQYKLSRFEGTLPAQDRPAGVVSVGRQDWVQLMRIDREVTKADRRRLLERLFAEEEESVRGVTHASKLASFVAIRRGSKALQVGPCIANDQTGPQLLRDVCHRYAGQPAYIDVPVNNRPAIAFVQGLGLTVQRELTRMCRGAYVIENVAELWASTGPEKG
jgi:ribosomal protein S18 acetylase RimI-like enzyme